MHWHQLASQNIAGYIYHHGLAIASSLASLLEVGGESHIIMTMTHYIAAFCSHAYMLIIITELKCGYHIIVAVEYFN